MEEKNYSKILTISIPTWNRGILLEKLLVNVTGQIGKHSLENKVEVLVSNNGSSDDTEAIVKSYMEKFKYISYNNNISNIGLGPNVIKSMCLASGKYCLLLGDDDRLRDGSLPPLIAYLEKNEGMGLLIDTSLSKKAKVETPVTISLTNLLERYYYYMGNAGVFVVLSEYMRQNHENRRFGGLSFSWPQVQYMILSCFNNPQKSIHVGNFFIHGENEHSNITLYNSFYVWKVAFYELVEDIENIRGLLNEETVKAARRYFSQNIIQNFYNILQCGVFVDDGLTREKTRKHILGHLSLFSPKEKILLWIIVIVLWLPVGLSRLLSDVFIYLIRGKKGIEKKNNFVNFEKKKIEILKNKKDTIIRPFSFEGSK